ncbi:hypothetical protein GUJ93_ZPchr0010g8699 [Zizania palustris]|uniref:Uncharacterized protein n=1 Tax=Zizania palustris TaxID=103762 RepID=A0A8J5WG28_ZIZPA|nr:hypothetical protein GUJ93_ZPchr0010g8699 [Zizania palustris]
MTILVLLSDGLDVLLSILLLVVGDVGLRSLGLGPLDALPTVGHHGEAALTAGRWRGTRARGWLHKAEAEGLKASGRSARELGASGGGARCRQRDCLRKKMT